jgi:site-specific DNA-methyltransferase (adenine-specific)
MNIQSEHRLIHGECLAEMAKLDDQSVDMICADLPYGTTSCHWDHVIDPVAMWKQYRRICIGPIVLTASQPFTTALIASNIKEFRYTWVWEKEQGVNFQLAKKQPLKVHEDVCVFWQGKQTIYNPQGLTACAINKSNKGKGGSLGHLSSEAKRDSYTQTVTGYPRSIQQFGRNRGLHPTQKPVALMEYLIKTYTNEGMTVLDSCMGSATTGVACVNTNRNFIGIEQDAAYYAIGVDRMQAACSLIREKVA